MSEETSAPLDLAARVDKHGRKFDAQKFLPVFDSAGRWKNRNAGRKKSSVKSSEPKPPAADAPPPSASAAPDFSDLNVPPASAAGTPSADGSEAIEGVTTQPLDKYTLAAMGTVGGITSIAIIGLGRHVKPDKEQVSAMVDAYADCYRHYGYAPETPPWAAPAIATLAWLGPHWQDERTQSTLMGWKIKFGAFIAKLRGRSSVRAAAEAAPRSAP